MDRSQVGEGRDVRKEAKGAVLALDPIRRLVPGGRVLPKVVHEPRAGDPLDELVAHAPHEARGVRVGSDRVAPLGEQRALGLLSPRRLERAETVAARLEVLE